jgi:glyoxylase-like metal-dependent hydrolase (beta-lactamase superfamily II)
MYRKGGYVTMSYELERLQVGPWPMNCYLVRCTETGEVAIVDPGAEPNLILAEVEQSPVRCILVTHGHPDHVGGLEVLRRATTAPVGVHPADAEAFALEADFALEAGQVGLGEDQLMITHVPGHTPGSVCVSLNGQVIVGDSIFPGGPGYTASPEALAQSLDSLERTVFTWPDGTELHPGHGDPTTVRAERNAFERFLKADRAADLCGDVSWA